MGFFNNANYGNIPLPIKGNKLRNTSVGGGNDYGYAGSCMTSDGFIIGPVNSTKVSLWDAKTGEHIKTMTANNVFQAGNKNINSFHNETNRIFVAKKNSAHVIYAQCSGIGRELIIENAEKIYFTLPESFQWVLPRWLSDSELWVLGFNSDTRSVMYIFKNNILVKSTEFVADASDINWLNFYVGKGWFSIDSPPDNTTNREMDYYTIDSNYENIKYRAYSPGGATNNGQEWTNGQYTQTGNYQIFNAAYNYNCNLIGFANGRGTGAYFEIYEINEESMNVNTTYVLIEVAYSDDGVVFSPFSVFDENFLPQSRFLKFHATFISNEQKSKDVKIEFDTSDPQFQFNLNEFLERVGTDIKLKTVYSEPFIQDTSYEDLELFKVGINKLNWKSINKLKIK